MTLRGKKILVTGAGGFIGSHLVERLLQENCQVRAMVRYNSVNKWGWLEDLPCQTRQDIEILPGDIRDQGWVKKAVQGQEIIFHLAALISIPFSYQAVQSYVQTNIQGLLNLLQAGLEQGIEKFLVTSTSEVYGTAQYVPIDEDHPLQAQSPYAASKIGADYLAQSFYRSFGLPVIIVRPFNTYGPRQSARAIIPTIITQLLAGQKKIQLGATHPTRDFVFVQDTVEGFIRLAQTKTFGKAVNIATGRETQIAELAQRLIQEINPQARISLDNQRLRPEQSEVDRLLGSNRRLQELTAWTPGLSLDKGLRTTIHWLKAHWQDYKYEAYNF